MSLENFKNGITSLILVVLVVAALVLALDAFQGDLDSTNACINNGSYSYNTTSRTCCHNLTGGGCGTAVGETVTLNVTREGLAGAGNASSYFSTIGTLMGVAALIAIVVGAFYFVANK